MYSFDVDAVIGWAFDEFKKGSGDEGAFCTQYCDWKCIAEILAKRCVDMQSDFETRSYMLNLENERLMEKVARLMPKENAK